jgi:hypothetical protein
MKKITITFIGTTLLSAASYATPQATVDISLLKSEAVKSGFLMIAPIYAKVSY